MYSWIEFVVLGCDVKVVFEQGFYYDKSKAAHMFRLHKTAIIRPYVSRKC
jgi:hypothetical protein